MRELLEILSPDFLLRDALIGSVLVGVVCPLVGAYFVLRRMIFLGVALPQLSAAGIAFSFVAYRLAVGPHEHGSLSERELAMLGSFAFTLGGLLVLTAFERRGRETVEARIGVTYAIAAALTILFLAVDPHGDAEMVNLLKGDILSTTRTSLNLLWSVFGAVVVSHAFVPGMVERRFGRVVNVSSEAGQLASMRTYAPAYAMSKAALNAFTVQLGEATRGTGVLVNSASPGWVRTAMGGPGAPRSVEEGADTIVWLATLPPRGPTAGFFSDRRAIPW